MKDIDILFSFIEEYYSLTPDERRNICVWIQRNIKEPYSYNVVWNEIINNTKYARTLVKEWHKQK